MDDDVHGPAVARDLGPATREPRPGLRRLEEIASLIFVLAGLGLVVIRLLGSSEGLPNAEIAALAVGLPYSALGVMVLLGGRSDRPALMATASMPLAFMSMVSAATILLLPIAVFLFVRGLLGLGSGRQRHLGWQELCLSSVLPAALVLAFGYLLFHEDPASWQSDGNTLHYSSNIVTVSESLLSLGAVALVLAVSYAWIVRQPVRRRGPATP